MAKKLEVFREPKRQTMDFQRARFEKYFLTFANLVNHFIMIWRSHDGVWPGRGADLPML